MGTLRDERGNVSFSRAPFTPSSTWQNGGLWRWFCGSESLARRLYLSDRDHAEACRVTLWMMRVNR